LAAFWFVTMAENCGLNVEGALVDCLLGRFGLEIAVENGGLPALTDFSTSSVRRNVYFLHCAKLNLIQYVFHAHIQLFF
jgi:hypothetical protein